jgi:hypothetical protein
LQDSGELVFWLQVPRLLPGRQLLDYSFGTGLLSCVPWNLAGIQALISEPTVKAINVTVLHGMAGFVHLIG